MTLSTDQWEQVRQRAGRACEYCGVTEVSAGGLLTVDHFQPRAQGGSDDLSNLVYCCHRCNLYKADYWPLLPGDPSLWNPRNEPVQTHLLTLADGMLYPITPMGTFTAGRLRLNRPALVAHRLSRLQHGEELDLLARQRELVKLLDQAQRQYAALLSQHRQFLDEQRALLKALLARLD